MRWINLTLGRALAFCLMLLPFAVVFIAYALGSEARLAVNPQDKLLPAPSKIAETAVRLNSTPDRRSGDILFLRDTWAYFKRLGLGVLCSAATGLIAGLAIGLFPYVRTAFSGFEFVLSMVPSLAVLPVLFIVFGFGEVSKVALVVIGSTLFLIRDLSQRMLKIPRELFVKAQTLGASSAVFALHVALPLLMPRLIRSVRLSLGPAGSF